MSDTTSTSYKHLLIEERVEIYLLWKRGVSFRTIARTVGRDVGTVSREIKRNRGRYTKEYTPVKAHELSLKRETQQRIKAPLKNVGIWLYVREKLKHGWSPETIEGRLPRECPGEYISYETIYQYIYGKGKKYKLQQYLTHRRKKRMKKKGRTIKRDSRIPDAVSIDKRPHHIDERVSIGHWESDNMLGKQADKTAVSVTTERVTRITHLSKVTKKSDSKIVALTYRLGPYPRKFKQTVTFDNGAENTKHKQIKIMLGMNTYFCHTYHSWEKGTVENTVGRVRRYIPKGASIDEMTEEQIQEIEEEMNNTPRKCLHFLTPNEKKLQVLHGKIPVQSTVALQL